MKEASICFRFYFPFLDHQTFKSYVSAISMQMAHNSIILSSHLLTFSLLILIYTRIFTVAFTAHAILYSAFFIMNVHMILHGLWFFQTLYNLSQAKRNKVWCPFTSHQAEELKDDDCWGHIGPPLIAFPVSSQDVNSAWN